ncbi:VanZ family protein [candidate division KSB1 bacterium]|nr:VanZ family protein [candidate division KSB1 bacterium]
MRKNVKTIYMSTGIIFLLFFAFVIYSADKGELPLFIRRMYMFPGGDKIGHFVLLFLLTFLVDYLFLPKSFLIVRKPVFIGSILVAGFISFEELTQIFISTRTFDLIDLLFSFMGIITGDLSARIFINRKVGI